MRGRRIGLAALLAGLCAAGCGGPKSGIDGSILDDAGSPDPPPQPAVEMPPSPVPYTVTTLRGSAPDAERVIVEGVDNPPSARVLMTSEFCIDVPIRTPDVYELTVRSQNMDGVLSEPSEPVMVEFDPDAPTDPSIDTCSGAPAEGCPRETEICGNGEDDNCNGQIDDDDPDCFDCEDDVFEPNDDIMAPSVEPMRHGGLQLCSMDHDFYGVYANEGETLDVRVFFSHAEGDIDVELYDPGGSVVQSSTSTTDDEAIEGYAATATGKHAVRVYSPDDAEVGYALDVEITGSGV